MRDGYVKYFIDSLNMNDEFNKLAEVLLKNKKDCNDFYAKYLGNNNYKIDDLLDFREDKLSIEDMSFDRFMLMCDNIGIKKAFEKTFLYHFDSQIVRFIENRIENDMVSLEDIYSSFVNNPNGNIMKNVL